MGCSLESLPKTHIVVSLYIDPQKFIIILTMVVILKTDTLFSEAPRCLIIQITWTTQRASMPTPRESWRGDLGGTLGGHLF